MLSPPPLFFFLSTELKAAIMTVSFFWLFFILLCLLYFPLSCQSGRLGKGKEGDIQSDGSSQCFCPPLTRTHPPTRAPSHAQDRRVRKKRNSYACYKEKKHRKKKQRCANEGGAAIVPKNTRRSTRPLHTHTHKSLPGPTKQQDTHATARRRLHG
jgi:hypothetical protein